MSARAASSIQYWCTKTISDHQALVTASSMELEQRHTTTYVPCAVVAFTLTVLDRCLPPSKTNRGSRLRRNVKTVILRCASQKSPPMVTYRQADREPSAGTTIGSKPHSA